MCLVQRALVFTERLCCWSEVTESPACRLGSTGGRMTSLVISNRGTVHPSVALTFPCGLGSSQHGNLDLGASVPPNKPSREGGRCC